MISFCLCPRTKTQTRALALLAVLLVTSGQTNADVADMDCDTLMLSGSELMSRGSLSSSLSPLLLDEPFSACVWRTEEEDEKACRYTKIPYAPVEAPPNPNWNGVDFKRELTQLVLNPQNYNVCEATFETDRVLQLALAPVSDLSQQQLQEYIFQSRFVRFYGEPPAEQWTPPKFSTTQRKILSVFDQLGDWTYCAGSKTGPLINGQYGKIVGRFDPLSRQTTFYNGLCTSKSLYGLDISFVTSTHAAFLISAHELGHGIDLISRNAPRRAQVSEAYATYYGTIFAECAARQFVKLRESYLKAISQSEQASELDVRYTTCQTRYWTHMVDFFREARQQIDLETGQVPSQLRGLNSEIEVLR